MDEPSEPDDVALMTRVREGDRDAFTTLVERHQGRVIGTIARMLGSPEEAEDLAQIVFVRVWKHAPGWQPTAKFTTWLLTITRNLVFNETRRRGRARLVSLDEPGEATFHEHPDSSVPTPAESLAQGELEAAVDAAIQSLPEQARLAVVLRRYEELSYEEIAEVLGTTVPAVKSLLFRTRNDLRERLRRFL